MSKLISRQQQIPNGFLFRIPELKWEAPRFASFDQIVQGIIVARKGNPHITQQRGWSTDPEVVANEVDAFNSFVCEKMGYWDYITGAAGGGSANPFPSQIPQAVPRLPNAVEGGGNRPLRRPVRQPILRPEEMPKMSGSVAQAVASVKKLAAGAATLLEWHEANMPHVDQVVADRRADICSRCPKNVSGKSLSEYFTVPLAGLIQKRFDAMNELGIKTPSDDKLAVCEACLCPLRTKVWFPDAMVLKRMKPEWKNELNQSNPRCWILELADAQPA